MNAEVVVLRTAVIVLTIGALWTLNDDARIVEVTENNYRDMVCAKDGWPDYKKLEPDCGEER